MRQLYTLAYFAWVMLHENLDPCTDTMRCDDYHGRFRRHWWQFGKYTR